MNVFNFKVKDIEGKEVSLDKYKGQLLLIINSATHCGFTPQYEALQKLHDTYSDKGFEILDFPCNQFMNQAPENNKEIKQFCELNYQTKFPQFSKIKVNGKEADPLFKYLKSEAPREYAKLDKQQGFISKLFFGNKVKWNFTKFLVDRQGKVVARFSPSYDPQNIATFIEKYI
ncbi:glutathione peroxidase [Mycoplasmatota bacterium]|nr:glutathione peroxidase [Mycoplasmatota bacterium]